MQIKCKRAQQCAQHSAQRNCKLYTLPEWNLAEYSSNSLVTSGLDEHTGAADEALSACVCAEQAAADHHATYIDAQR